MTRSFKLPDSGRHSQDHVLNETTIRALALSAADGSRAAKNGGYDEGYRSVPCFWGTSPGSLVRAFADSHSLSGVRVLDAGSGEGKNAAFLAGRGAGIVAVDVSAAGLQNASETWPAVRNVEWVRGDVRTIPLARERFDIVVAYGLFHCLLSRSDIAAVVARLNDATRPGGHHIVCCFNARRQDLSGHPGFEPCLLEHGDIVGLYDGWSLSHVSDRDLHETHPHNQIPHVHSMTRLIARKDP